MDISTTYGAPGVTTTTNGMGGMGGDDEVSAMIKELVRRRMNPDIGRPNNALAIGGSTNRVRPQRITHMEQGLGPERGPSWQSVQGAAMRPTGLGAQMVPGMGIDPRFLPPGLRPQSSSFAGPMGPSAAGLSNEPQSMPGPSSNSGFDYLSPIERARALSAAQRGR